MIHFLFLYLQCFSVNNWQFMSIFIADSDHKSIMFYIHYDVLCGSIFCANWQMELTAYYVLVVCVIYWPDLSLNVLMYLVVDFCGRSFCSFVLPLILHIFLLCVGAFAAAEVSQIF